MQISFARNGVGLTNIEGRSMVGGHHDFICTVNKDAAYRCKVNKFI